jgi:hypothetical protein
MLLSIIITIVCSLCIIWFGHYLWNYLKDQYSVKKRVYLVDSQIDKYKNIIKELQSEPVLQPDDLKSDLEEFLHQLPKEEAPLIESIQIDL